MPNQDRNYIGGLYIQQSQSGLEYLKGFINLNEQTYRIVAFYNDNKKSDTQPDYSIVMANENPNEQKPSRPARPARPAARKASRPAPKAVEPEEEDGYTPF